MMDQGHKPDIKEPTVLSELRLESTNSKSALMIDFKNNRKDILAIDVNIH